MPENYTHALLRTAHTTDPQRATASLIATLQRRGRLKLLPKIKALLDREAVRAQRQPRELLVVAHAGDLKKARDASGLTSAPAFVDPTIIGGYQARVGDSLTDASFKKKLQDVYNRATA